VAYSVLLYYYIIWVKNSRRMRWAECVERMEKGEVHTGFWWENLRNEHYLGDIVGNVRMILK
jgi:hypothetical protein